MMDAAQLVSPQRVAGRAPGVTSARYLGEVGASLRKEQHLGEPPKVTQPHVTQASVPAVGLPLSQGGGKGGEAAQRARRLQGSRCRRGPLTSHAAALRTGGVCLPPEPRTFCQHRPADPRHVGGLLGEA